MPTTFWKPIIIALGVVGGILFVLLIIIGFGVLKGRQRTKQKFERRNSLRASIRASKQSVYTNKHALNTTMTSVGSRGTSRAGTAAGFTPHTDSMAKKKRPTLGRVPRDDSAFFNLSGYTAGETSTDSIDKYKMGLDSHRPPSPTDTLEYSSQSQSQSKIEGSSYFDSDLQDYYPHRLENEIAHIMARPMYDNVFNNDAYDERSLDRSQVPAVPPYRQRQGHDLSTSSELPPTRQRRGHDTSTSSEFVDQPYQSQMGRTPRSKPPRPRPKETAM